MNIAPRRSCCKALDHARRAANAAEPQTTREAQTTRQSPSYNFSTTAPSTNVA